MHGYTTYQQDIIQSKPWSKARPPRKILAIRLHALGDVVITLPYLQYLKKSLPNTKLDLLIREETEEIPKNILLFNKIYSIGGGRNYKKQLLYSTMILPQLYMNNYDVIIDLQNNIVSKFFRKALMPEAWAEFDRFSPNPAGERTKKTIEATGLGQCFTDTDFVLKNKKEPVEILKKAGWKKETNLVILNPAGAFETRNWPVENFLAFAKIWLAQFPETQFVVLGVGKIAEKASYLEYRLGSRLLNLVNTTTPSQAFGVVQYASFILSEDSGLMHIAWVSGIPTFALFGSTRSDWAKPLGEHARYLDSSDLACGNCMKEHCKFGDTHCLTRYSAEYVFEKANLLMNKYSNEKSIPGKFAGFK
jgi:heptosyltransferase-2